MVGGPHAGGQRVGDVVGQLHGLLLGGEPLHREHGAEGLLLHQLVLLAHPRDDRGLNEEAVRPGHGCAAGLHRGVGGHILQLAAHVLVVPHVVERAVGVLGLVRLARDGGLGLRHEQPHELVVGGVLHEHAGHRGAVLTGVERAEGHELLRGPLQVRVREDHGRGLAAQLQVGALQPLRGVLGHGASGPHGTGDGDHGGRAVARHERTRATVAQHHVQDARGEDLPGQAREHQRGLRGGVTGLEHDRVARGQGGADLPQAHEQGVVPRGHLSHHTHRLPADVGGVLGHVLHGRPALQGARGTREEAQVVRPGGHLLVRDLRARLARVAVLGLHELVRVRLEGVRELEEQLLALPRGGPAPGLRGGGRGLEGGVHVLLVGDRGDGHGGAVRGVHDLDGLLPVRGHEPSVDVVLQCFGQGSLLAGWVRTAWHGIPVRAAHQSLCRTHHLK